MSNGAATGAASSGQDRCAAGLRLAATVTGLAAGLAVLWRAGRFLPPLPLDATGIMRASEEADPLALAVSLLRLLPLGAGAGLLGATALGLAARSCGAARLVVGLDRWTPAGLRRLLDGAVGVGLAASIGLSAVPAGADAGGDARTPAPATIRRLPDAATTSTLRRLPDPPSEVGPPAAGPVSTLRRLPDALPPGPAPPPPTPATSAAPGVAAIVPAPGAPATTTEVVVQPGDSFWRLAERHEAQRLGRQPTEAETGACWQELVARNRPRLAVPDDPDLLFPGQVVDVPCT